MRERKFIKLRVDMFGDTKFKIIDTMEERDLIHYIWTRLITLAGKVNLEGDLYLSRNIPYTAETLAIEFNREVAQVKLALDTLINLEMVEFTKDKIYRVKNFVKHQNIKVKEKAKIQDSMEEVRTKEELEKITQNKQYEKIQEKQKIQNKVIKNPSVEEKPNNNPESKSSVDNNHQENDLQACIPMPIKKKKTKEESKNRAKNIQYINDIDETDEQEENIIDIYDGYAPEREGDKVIMGFSM